MKWKVQKENNRGFSLVAVISSIGIVSVLVVMILTLTLMNYRMKLTNLNAQKTFYTAEEALDEISQGLAKQLSLSASEAYVYTMSNYNSLESDARYTVFTGKLVDSMRGTLCAGTSGTTNYSVPYLESLLVYTGYDDYTGIGAKVSCLTGGNFLNATKDALVLKNVIVAYYGADDYFSEIQTDIVVSYPQIDFTQKSGTPNLLSYSLVADDRFSVTGATGVNIYGNAYLGKEGVEFKGSKVTFSQAADTDEQNTLITGSGISIDLGSNVTVKDLEVWANSILVDASTADISGSVYLSNDLVVDNTIQTSAKVKLSGAFYAYGNPDIIKEASSMTGETENIEKSPAEYSSSVILNGSKSTVDLYDLDTMMIAGNSYIGSTKYTGSTTGTNSADVLMGDSIAVKTEQTAYLIPAECVAPDSEYGGTNPMTVAQYEKLKASVGDNDIVDYAKKSSSLGGASLQSLGVTKFQTAYYVVTGTAAGSSSTEMVYLFMVFDSTNSAGNFATTYYEVMGNLSKLDSNLELYQNQILVPSALSEESTVGSSFFLNGNLVSRVGSDSAVYLNTRLTGDSTSEDYQTMASSVQEYRDIYSALGIKLTRKYYALTNEEKSKGVYENLIYNMASVSNTSAQIGGGSNKIFVSSELTDEPIAAVVINNSGEGGTPYKISSDKVNNISGPDENGVTVSNARLCLVIASGDVEVAADFKGLIIAGGTITVDGGVTIAPDSTTVALAFTMKNQEGVSVSDYVIDADSYTIGGLSGSTGSSGGSIVYADLITYENWKKQ
jgi:type II secretory pathway pseudopilin PulG